MAGRGQARDKEASEAVAVTQITESFGRGGAHGKEGNDQRHV